MSETPFTNKLLEDKIKQLNDKYDKNLYNSVSKDTRDFYDKIIQLIELNLNDNQMLIKYSDMPVNKDNNIFNELINLLKNNGLQVCNIVKHICGDYNESCEFCHSYGLAIGWYGILNTSVYTKDFGYYYHN